jgi:hypothetical protein
MNMTISPSGSAGVTTAENVTASPSVDGFNKDERFVAVPARQLDR